MKNSLIFYFKNNIKKSIPLNKLNYLEHKIIEKSKNYFNDDDPCIIHSTYCINLLSIELFDKIKETRSYGKYNTLDLPTSILSYIKIDEELEFIEIREEDFI